MWRIRDRIRVGPLEPRHGTRNPGRVSADLRSSYLGLDLSSPIVASASPLTGDLGSLVELERAGAAAVVLPSLFEEQVEHEQLHTPADPSHPLADGLPEYPGELNHYALGPQAYLEHLRRAKAALAIPVIASVNGVTAGGWVRYAELLQQAGADAIELNVYAVEADQYVSSAAVEERTLRLVTQIRQAVSVPLAVKLSPYYTALPFFASQLADARVDGLVLFNRFVQPDIDLERLAVEPTLHLSHREELRLPLRWIAILHGRLPLSLAATSGVEDETDVVKLLLVGADVVMLASELLRSGPARLTELRDGLAAWLDEHGYPSVAAVRGSLSQVACGAPGSFERAHYVRALTQAPALPPA